MKLALSATISEIDAFCEKSLGLPVVDLMKKSGQAVAYAVRKRTPKGKSVIILAGKGNNGGDGYATAVELMEEYDVTVYDVFGKGQKNDCGKYFLNLFKSRGGRIESFSDTREVRESIRNAGCIVDAVFGTGFVGEMPEDVKPLAIMVSEAVEAHKIAIDVPLGINADNGSVSEFVFSVEATVALSYVKPGILSYPARAYVGEIIYAPLGIPTKEIEKNFKFRYNLVDEDWAVDVLPERALNSNKGSFGKLLVICGSESYRGAAHLAVEAALRGGVGAVRFVGVPELVDGLAAKFPEVIYEKCGNISTVSDLEIERICELSSKNDATLIGSGSENTEGLLRLTLALLSCEGGALILDADAINALAGIGERGIAAIREAKRKVILTPHPLEFARLIGSAVAAVQLNRLNLAESFAEQNRVILVLKGAGTIITDGKEVYINVAGSSSLAKAGSGDVLAGAIASIVAQKSADALVSSALAVYIHASSGDSLANQFSTYGVTPSDLPKEMARHLSELEKRQKNEKEAKKQ